MQGWYNIAHKRGYINIPNGEIILFGAACAQIVSPRRCLAGPPVLTRPLAPIDVRMARSTRSSQSWLQSMDHSRFSCSSSYPAVGRGKCPLPQSSAGVGANEL
jgi:hypothetical protein